MKLYRDDLHKYPESISIIQMYIFSLQDRQGFLELTKIWFYVVPDIYMFLLREVL